MYGPSGYVESSETDWERTKREENDARHRKIIEEYEASKAAQPRVEKPQEPVETSVAIPPQPPVKEFDNNGKKPGREAKRNLRKTGFRNKQDFEKHYGIKK